ncbi:MAG TPA: hypothetical protein DCR13_05705 [Gammaproteobacteria bacterium]|nr:hypothetical protein [Gammaproteobacteria bacterium]
MEIEQVPFAAHNGIEITPDNSVYLPENTRLNNHLSGVHAGAQFLLAESASGYYLLTAFPEFIGRITPLLRESSIRYSQQIQGALRSRIKVDDATIGKFRQTLAARSRAVIQLEVELINQQDLICCTASFRWFVRLQPEQLEGD